MAGQTYTGGGVDTIVREFVEPVQPNTAAQQAQKNRIRRGAQGWGSLTDGQRAQWASTVASFGIKAKGTRRLAPQAMTPANYYTSLTSKFLACSPLGTVPVLPPATKFGGDTVGFVVTPNTGSLRVTATNANRAGVKTEIMVQRLAASYRKPTPSGYRTKAFVAFATGALSTDIPVSPGAYSVAVQFVNVATGETSGYQVLGVQSVALALEDGGMADEAAGFEAAQAA